MHESASELSTIVNLGIVVSSDLYYPPTAIEPQKWMSYGGVCIEMESAVLFSYALIKQGLHAATILTSDGNLVTGGDIYGGDTQKKLDAFNAGVTQSIQIAINMIDRYYK